VREVLRYLKVRTLIEPGGGVAAEMQRRQYGEQQQATDEH
jgi:hypothetical protein